jgi:hypothetical protein
VSDEAPVASAPVESAAPAEAEVSEKSNDTWDDEPEQAERKPKPSPPKAEPEKPAPKLRKIKVGDVEETVDEDEVFRDVQKYRAADKKFREAAEMQKNLEHFMETLQKDPAAVLNDPRIPINRRELAEKWLLAEIEREMADPRDLKVQEYEQKLKEYQERERQEQEYAKRQEHEQRKELKRKEISEMFTKALESTPLGKAPEVAAEALRDMALYMRTARANGENPDPSEIAKHVETKYLKAMHSLAGSMEGDSLLDFLGPDLVKKVNKAYLSKHRAAQETPTQQFKNEEVVERKQAPKRLDPFSAREEVRRKLGL